MKKYFKPIIVMLSIILFCGGLLAILSDVLAVSDSERVQRAINSIYKYEIDNGEQITLVEEIDTDSVDMSEYDAVGTVKNCYKLNNGDYMVLSTGKKGYSNGKITTYVAIDSLCNVKKVVQHSYSGQTLMSKLGGIYAEYNGKNASDPKSEFDGIVATGATYSSHAVSNSVYVALKFAEKVEKSGG